LITVKRGEFIISVNKFAQATGMSIQQVRTFFDLLINDSMINKVASTKSTKICICNYDLYNDLQQTNNKPATNKQQTSNKPATTNKNNKNVKNKENNIKEREEIFKNQVWQYDDKYPGEMLADFVAYWTEHGENDKKMRFEKQNTWGLIRRLSTWYKNYIEFKKINGTDKKIIKGVNDYWPSRRKSGMTEIIELEQKIMDENNKINN